MFVVFTFAGISENCVTGLQIVVFFIVIQPNTLRTLLESCMFDPVWGDVVLDAFLRWHCSYIKAFHRDTLFFRSDNENALWKCGRMHTSSLCSEPLLSLHCFLINAQCWWWEETQFSCSKYICYIINTRRHCSVQFACKKQNQSSWMHPIGVCMFYSKCFRVSDVLSCFHHPASWPSRCFCPLFLTWHTGRWM